MKKQGDLYLKIVSIVLAGIVVAYLVLSVLFGSGGSSYTLDCRALRSRRRADRFRLCSA